MRGRFLCYCANVYSYLFKIIPHAAIDYHQALIDYEAVVFLYSVKFIYLCIHNVDL